VNGSLIGYEIKSDYDTLDRLPNQMREYSKFFEKLIVVVGAKYLNSVKKLIPDYCGITMVEQIGSEVRFKTIKKPKPNPLIEVSALCEVLWKEELLAYLHTMGVIKGTKSKSRLELRDRIAEVAEIEDILNFVRLSLKGRQRWRVD
jgi:hypothetical protein